MCTKNGSYCENEKREKKSGGGGMSTKNGSYCEKEKSRGDQVRCERRSETFVKIKKKIIIFFSIFFLGGGGGRVGGGGVRVDVKGEVKLL